MDDVTVVPPRRPEEIDMDRRAFFRGLMVAPFAIAGAVAAASASTPRRFATGGVFKPRAFMFGDGAPEHWVNLPPVHVPPSTALPKHLWAYELRNEHVFVSMRERAGWREWERFALRDLPNENVTQEDLDRLLADHPSRMTDERLRQIVTAEVDRGTARGRYDRALSHRFGVR
jgi:hypothetical protein